MVKEVDKYCYNCLYCYVYDESKTRPPQDEPKTERAMDVETLVCRRCAPRPMIDGVGFILRSILHMAGKYTLSEQRNIYDMVSEGRFDWPVVHRWDWCGEWKGSD